ncbi:MAG TPA: sigma-70 family RNA polymerase sigma factor [Gemmatimonadaceae bacterium]
MTDTPFDPSLDVGRLLAEQRDRLRIVVYAIVEDPDVADDLVGETILRFINAVAHEKSIVNPPAYLLGIGRVAALEYFRKQKRMVRLDDEIAAGREPSSDSAASTNVADEDAEHALRYCLKKLRPADRALILDYYDDATRSALAAELGIALKALHVRASRLRTHLRRCVAKRMSRG